MEDTDVGAGNPLEDVEESLDVLRFHLLEKVVHAEPVVLGTDVVARVGIRHSRRRQSEGVVL